MSNTTRKLNKFKVTVAIVIIVLFVLTVTGFGRFLYNSVRDRYLASKNFYFTSNLLTDSNKEYEYENWDGYGIYKIEIDLYSKGNDLQVPKELNYEAAELTNTYDNTTQIDTVDREVGTEAEYSEVTDDLDYNIYLEFPKALECAIDNNTGVGYEYDFSGAFADPDTDLTDTESSSVATGKIKVADNRTGKVTIFVQARTGTSLPRTDDFEDYYVKVIAYTKEPYRKSLSATFKFKITDLSYEIEDANGRDYAIVNIRNANDVPSDVTLSINNLNSYAIDLNDNWIPVEDDAATAGVNSAYITDASGEPKLAKKVTFRMERDSSTKIRIYKGNDNGTLNPNSITVTRKERTEE